MAAPLAAGGNESELVERARQGDVGAYEQLVRTYQDLAGRTAYVVLGDSAEAQDAVQEGFMKAYRALARFRPGAPFRPWLLRIVANEALNRRRVTRRLQPLGLRPAVESIGGLSDPSAESVVIEREGRDELLAAVNALRLDDRLVIAYRYWLELPEAEMADALGIARGTVKSRLSRAMDRLRARLTDQARTAGEQPTVTPYG